MSVQSTWDGTSEDPFLYRLEQLDTMLSCDQDSPAQRLRLMLGLEELLPDPQQGCLRASP